MLFKLRTLRNALRAAALVGLVVLMIHELANFVNVAKVPKTRTVQSLNKPNFLKSWNLSRSKSIYEIAESYNQHMNVEIDRYSEPRKTVLFNLTSERINRFLSRIQWFESRFRDQLEYLDVMIFDEVLAYNEIIYFKQYEYEFKEFTIRTERHLRVNEKFAQVLSKRSDYISFVQPMYKLPKMPLEKVQYTNSNISGESNWAI